MKLKTNTKAPNFKLPCTDKSIFQLSKIKKKNIILYFYPKDDTPGCTIESKDFSKQQATRTDIVLTFKKFKSLI